VGPTDGELGVRSISTFVTFSTVQKQDEVADGVG